MESLALDDGSRYGARGSGALPGDSAEAYPAGEAVSSSKGRKISAAQKAMWGNLTPRERAEKSLARYEIIKHPTATQKKAIATLRAKLAGKLSYARAHPDKQAIYQARFEARKKGLPLPPLPGKMETKEERKRRADREYQRKKRLAVKAAKRAKKKQATGESVVWNKPGKSAEPTYVNAGAQPQVRQETEAATGT